MEAARRQRIAELNASHAFIVLQASGANISEIEIQAAANDRADVKAFFGKEIPCALLDQIGGDLRTGEALGFHRIDAREQGWLRHLQAWLASTLAMTVDAGR